MDKILKVIQERQSTRGLFDSERAILKTDLMQILEAARWGPTAHNMQNFEIIVVDDKKLLDSIANIKSPISKIFVKENYQQLSFSEEELLKKKTGILGKRFPESWRTPEARLTGETHETGVSTLGRIVQTTSVILVLTYDPNRRAPASEGDFLGIMSLGFVIENMWLMAQSLGISFHIMSVLGNDPVEKEVKQLLNIPSNLKIALAIRLGYPASGTKSFTRIRRDINDFTHHNKFGNKDYD